MGAANWMLPTVLLIWVTSKKLCRPLVEAAEYYGIQEVSGRGIPAVSLSVRNALHFRKLSFLRAASMSYPQRLLLLSSRVRGRFYTDFSCVLPASPSRPNLSIKTHLVGGDGSWLRAWASRGPGLNAQHPQPCSQPSVTGVPDDVTLFPGFQGGTERQCWHNTHTRLKRKATCAASSD